MPKSRDSSRDSSIHFSEPPETLVTSDMEQEETPPVNDQTTRNDLHKQVTNRHPMGKLLLRMAGQHNDLCEKGNNTNIVNLDNLCQDFYENLQLEQSNLRKKLTKQNGDIEAIGQKLTAQYDNIGQTVESSILEKEMNFSSMKQSIDPPKYFSDVPVLTTAKTLNETLKIFPTRHSNKFDGSGNILEFLTELNSCQEIARLSEPEFLQMLTKCLTKDPYFETIEYIQYKYKPADIYFALISLYDKRLSPSEARKELNDINCHKGWTIVKLQAKIMKLASRIASDLPPGEGRGGLYNLEATNALKRCVPTQSKQLITNQHNTLCAKLMRTPTFIEITKCLLPFHDSINEDIYMNSPVAPNSKSYKPNYHSRNNSNYSGKNKIFMIESSDKEQIAHNDKPYSQERTNKYRGPFGKKSMSEPNERNKKYCSLCGSNSHNASDICYKMRTDQNRIIQCVPSYDRCKTCYLETGKELFHAPKYCFLRPNYPKEKRGIIQRKAD